MHRTECASIRELQGSIPHGVLFFSVSDRIKLVFRELVVPSRAFLKCS